ncbi:MAG TPA: hypothetical protein DCW71_00655 [Alistipes sp.]|nr:hypothetical protein [Alistipes sp.]
MDHPARHAARVFARSTVEVHRSAIRSKGFSEYYRIGRKPRSASARVEPRKNNKQELKSRSEGSHSLFGIIWQIASATGWSVRHILWKIPYTTLMLMLADAPHLEDGPPPEAQSETRCGGVKSAETVFQTLLSPKP